MNTPRKRIYTAEIRPEIVVKLHILAESQEEADRRAQAIWDREAQDLVADAGCLRYRLHVQPDPKVEAMVKAVDDWARKHGSWSSGDPKAPPEPPFVHGIDDLEAPDE